MGGLLNPNNPDNQLNQITGIDYVAGQAGIDAVGENLITTNNEHHHIHEGSHFNVSGFAQLAINNVYDIQFTTPNTTTYSHFTFVLTPESETEWHIYEGATVSVAGTAMTPRNNNRNSGTASVNTLKYHLNTSLANANADTVVSGATDLLSGIVGSGRDAGIVVRSNEIILKKNTVYCFRAIATAAGYVDFLMSWYEQVNKN